MNITKVVEYSVTPDQSKQINALLQSCFSGYPNDRNYYKSLPSFRLLAEEKDNLIGHLAIVFREIKIGTIVSRIFGISDVCVHPDYRSKNIASLMLAQTEQFCRDHRIDFLVLIAQNHELYTKQGFNPVNNTCRWLLINDHQSLGVMHGQLDKSMMVKATGKQKWQEGLVDMLGGIF